MDCCYSSPFLAIPAHFPFPRGRDSWSVLLRYETGEHLVIEMVREEVEDKKLFSRAIVRCMYRGYSFYNNNNFIGIFFESEKYRCLEKNLFKSLQAISL